MTVKNQRECLDYHYERMHVRELSEVVDAGWTNTIITIPNDRLTS